jgi:hypothetical protein
MMHPLFRSVVVPLFVLLLSSSNQVLASDAVDDGVLRSLVVSEIVTTAACNEIRFDKYRARLDLFYFYTVIFTSDNSMPVDVTGIENAIAHAVASALSGCDDQERPLYAVKLSVTGHALSSGRKLLPLSLLLLLQLIECAHLLSIPRLIAPCILSSPITAPQLSTYSGTL